MSNLAKKAVFGEVPRAREMDLIQAADAIAARYPHAQVIGTREGWQVIDSPIHWEGGLDGHYTQKNIGPCKPTHRQAVIATAELLS